MGIIVFFSMLGASLLLGLCYGILYVPKKRFLKIGFKSYNRVEELLMKIHQPTLKIVISLLIAALLYLSWQQACGLDERWYVQGMFTALFLIGVYVLALLMYVCVHPYYLEKKSLLVNGTRKENKRTHLILLAGFAIISAGAVIYLLLTGGLLHFVLFPCAFLIVQMVAALLWFCWFLIHILFLSEYSVVRFCGDLWSAYWKWVLEH